MLVNVSWPVRKRVNPHFKACVTSRTFSKANVRIKQNQTADSRPDKPEIGCLK